MAKKKLLTAAMSDPVELDALIAARLEIAHSAATALVVRGAVQVDGRRASDPNAQIVPGARLTVYLPEDAAASDEPAIVFAFRDAFVAVVDKPAGMPSQATRADAASALDARVQAELPDARMMHRLDRDASGLVLFALDPAARAPLQRALELGKIDRRYVAVVSGHLEGEGRIALRIGRDAHDERRRLAHPESTDTGQAAVTLWKALRHGATSTVLELTLETGRTHQLRVHLSALGHPILGDRLYGGAPAERLCLHAEHLSLRHPMGRRRIVVSSPAPAALLADSPP